MTITEVAWLDPDAVALRAAMAEELNARYADRMPTDGIAAALRVDDRTVAYTALARDDTGLPVGHVAMRWRGADLEVKRLYVTAEARGTGVSGALMAAAERAALVMGAARIVLQTGDRQPEAVGLYEKIGYTPIPVFPPYDAVPFSLCFAKPVTTPAPGGTTPPRC